MSPLINLLLKQLPCFFKKLRGLDCFLREVGNIFLFFSANFFRGALRAVLSAKKFKDDIYVIGQIN